MPDYISPASHSLVSWPSTGYQGITNYNPYSGLTSVTCANLDPWILQCYRRRQESPIIPSSADIKSVELLWNIIAQEQKTNLINNGWFEIEGSSGRIFRLFFHRHGNVQLIKDGKVSACWCGHFGETLPTADTIVAQILTLQANEEEYINNANVVLPEHIQFSRPEVGYREFFRIIINAHYCSNRKNITRYT